MPSALLVFQKRSGGLPRIRLSGSCSLAQRRGPLVQVLLEFATVTPAGVGHHRPFESKSVGNSACFSLCYTCCALGATSYAFTKLDSVKDGHVELSPSHETIVAEFALESKAIAKGPLLGEQRLLYFVKSSPGSFFGGCVLNFRNFPARH